MDWAWWVCFLTDLSNMDFFLWDALKRVVYATPVDFVMDLVARIVCAAADIQQNSGVFECSANPSSDDVAHGSLTMEETWNLLCDIFTNHIPQHCNILSDGDLVRW
ncbi:hypothetical protein TNIN_153211 [Trichonephila inaurata madagascariensis]|uniref:Uncharacterized protein n=1 Tax=Trichonephila inaurata madagascariensis TaxID=2747483 RepID=A0A8X6WLR4_9ARAC|nr:hypothetical protein TNIN_153211 [Trichonephila inaurata madagascariensis]